MANVGLASARPTPGLGPSAWLPRPLPKARIGCFPQVPRPVPPASVQELV